MRPSLFPNLITATALSGMALILGCGDESRKSPAAGVNGEIIAPAKPDAALQSNPAAVTPDVVPAPATPPQLSPATEQVVQLAHASVGDEVLLAFIDQSSGGYHLKVDEILYLHDVGLSAPVIAAMVRRDDDSTAVRTNEMATASAKPEVSPVPPDTNAAAEPASFSLSSETPQTVAAEGPASETVNYNYFYNGLAPYGNWVQVANYGWCWQPTVAIANPAWRPYCDSGRWLWSNCGWYWQSSYSWGWMPFHYGRWFCGSSGWMWTPGTVWGPSWVTWCNSGSYCGWAPLPPACGFSSGVGLTFGGGSVGVNFGFGLGYNCWTFVPRSYVCNFSPWYYRVPSSRVPTMVNNGTIINNYVNGSGNNTVINVGPGLDSIASVSRSEIRRVNLRDASVAPGQPIQADRLDRSGSTLTVYRPNLPQQAPAPPQQVLARQQEVRRNSEALVKSDVVRLAQAETVQRATASPRSVGSANPGVRTAASGSGASPAIAPRSEVRASTPGQTSRNRTVSAGETRRLASTQSTSTLSDNSLPSPERSTVRAPSGGSARPVQWTAPTSSTSGPSRYTPAPRPVSTTTPVPPSIQNSPQSRTPARTEARNPVYRNSGSPSPGYQTIPPAPAGPTVVPTRPIGSGYSSPPAMPTPAPRSYSPSPAMQPARPSPAPSYSPGPSPSRSPSSSPSPGGRPGPGRATL